MNFKKNMLYFTSMMRYRQVFFYLVITASLIISSPDCASGQEHIRKLDTVRASMSKLGSSLPSLIRKAQPADIRTMERVFEINNYSLAAIESYFKMIKIAVASGTRFNKDVTATLNGWLKFISNYSEYDIKYLDEALAQTKDTTIIEILQSEKNNISSLRDATQFAVNENTAAGNKL